jgi:glycosyltransferase involved in cell wall biosynthesis
MTEHSRIVAAGARRGWLWRNRQVFSKPVSGELPRMLVDVSAIYGQDAQTGIQRVVRAVWAELQRRSGSGFEAIPVVATRSAGYCYVAADFLGGRRNAVASKVARAGPNDVFLGLDLTAHLLPKYVPQVRAWRRNGATVHVVVYDLLPLTHPQWFTSTTVRNFRSWFGFLASEADQVVCISETVRNGLRNILPPSAGGAPVELARMELGGDIAASVPSEGIDAESAAAIERMRFRPSVLMVATVEPRKGYDVALRAFEHLWRTHPAAAPDLVIVGKPGWKTAALQERIRGHAEHGRRLFWMTQVSDEALCKLYDHCRGVFVPSHAEGFGLPLLEAATARRPVLARDLPVFREQGLPNVLFFDNDDEPHAIGERLVGLTKISAAAFSADDLPTWKNCVDGLLQEIGIQESSTERAKSAFRKAS